ncbi:MAG TPA: M67 family metallopeptidase [Acidimicrobiales bacterium]|nr:M67 family metallopeptidase [Acidimicrobiales bacterium]
MTESGGGTAGGALAGQPVGSSELVVGADLRAEMVAHCLRAYPEEGCGLLAGDPATGAVLRLFPTRNAAASSRLYTVDPLDHLRADRRAEEEGISIIGVFHSHTHTDPYPSQTDVAQAPDPSWHYVVVSLRDEVASIRSYRIIGDSITEEPIVEAG